MYAQWKIKAGDVAAKLNRYYTYEEQEIISAAEECGYVDIAVEDDLIEGLEHNGRLCTIAEY